MDKEQKNTIESHSSRLSRDTKPFFVPDWLHILLFLLTGFLILTLLNIRSIWRYFTGVKPDQNVNAFDSHSFQGILNAWSSLTNSRLTQILLWLIVGIWIYLIIWFAKNIFINVYNDMAASEFVHPKAYKKKYYWESVVGLKVLFVLSFLTLGAFIAAGIKLASALSDQFYLGVADFRIWHSVEIWATTILSAAILLYIFTVLIHIVVNSGRSIYKGL